MVYNGGVPSWSARTNRKVLLTSETIWTNQEDYSYIISQASSHDHHFLEIWEKKSDQNFKYFIRQKVIYHPTVTRSYRPCMICTWTTSALTLPKIRTFPPPYRQRGRSSLRHFPLWTALVVLLCRRKNWTACQSSSADWPGIHCSLWRKSNLFSLRKRAPCCYDQFSSNSRHAKIRYP